MYKQEFVSVVSKKTKLPKKKVNEVVDVISNVITSTLKKDDIIQWKGLGTFKLVERQKRECRNPRTGKKITVPKRKVVSFKLGTTLKSIKK